MFTFFPFFTLINFALLYTINQECSPLSLKQLAFKTVVHIYAEYNFKNPSITSLLNTLKTDSKSYAAIMDLLQTTQQETNSENINFSLLKKTLCIQIIKENNQTLLKEFFKYTNVYLNVQQCHTLPNLSTSYFDPLIVVCSQELLKEVIPFTKFTQKNQCALAETLLDNNAPLDIRHGPKQDGLVHYQWESMQYCTKSPKSNQDHAFITPLSCALHDQNSPLIKLLLSRKADLFLHRLAYISSLKHTLGFNFQCSQFICALTHIMRKANRNNIPLKPWYKIINNIIIQYTLNANDYKLISIMLLELEKDHSHQSFISTIRQILLSKKCTC